MTPPAPRPASPAVPPARPLKPRPILFRVLCIVFALWMATLAVLYAKVVWPERPPGHKMTTPTPVAP